MKHSKILGLFLISSLMLLAFSLFAQAVEVRDPNGNSVNPIIIPVTYENLVSSEATTINTTQALTLINMGAAAETENLGLITQSGYTLSIYEQLANGSLMPLSGAALTFTLASQASKTIQIKTLVPLTTDSGLHDIGTLMVNGQSYPIKIQVKSLLSLESLVVDSDDKTQTINNNNGKISDLHLGKQVDIQFKIKNLFNGDYSNGDITNGDLRLYFKDDSSSDNYGDSLDETTNFDVNSGVRLEGSDVELHFTIPNKARAKIYTIIVELEGEDNNGARHNLSWTLNMEVRRQTDDVRLNSAVLTSQILKCERNNQLKISFTNFGRNVQNDAALSVYNQALGISANLLGLVLSQDPNAASNTLIRTIPFNVSDSVRVGEYVLEVRAYINQDTQVDYKEVKLTVQECPKPAASNNNQSIIVTTTGGTSGTSGQTVSGTSNLPIIESLEKTNLGVSLGVLIFMGVLGFLLLVTIILLILVLARKGRHRD